MDEVGPHSMKKRTLKSDKKKKGRQSKADPKRKNFVAWKKDGLLMKEQFIMEQEGDIIISFVCNWFYDIKSLLWRNYGNYHLNSK